jgi:predicted RNA binding protein YcfA (HicA-like mRNA interferase family)
VGKYEKIILKILSGQADANIPFDDLCKLLQGIGFVMRIRGSHHVFRKDGIEEKINLQQEGNKSKPYQVRQVRYVILKYQLGGEQ